MSNSVTEVKSGWKKIKYNLNSLKNINFKLKAVGSNGLNTDKSWKVPTIYFGIYGTDSDVTPYTSALSGGQSTTGAGGVLLIDFTTAANVSSYLVQNYENLQNTALTSTRYLWFYVTQGKDTVIGSQTGIDVSATLLTMRYSAVCLGSIKSILDTAGLTAWKSGSGPVANFYYADQRDPFPDNDTGLATRPVKDYSPSADYPNLVVTIMVNNTYISQSRTLEDENGNKTTTSTTDYYFVTNYEGDMTTQILSGDGVPANTLGSDGDVYFDTTNLVYYKKNNSSWSKILNITTYGSRAPASTLGSNGDIYLDTTNDIYYKKSNSSWNVVKLEDLLGLIADTRSLTPKYLLGYSSNTGGNVLMWGKDFGTLISTKIDITHAVAYLNANANSRLQGNFETFRFPAKWTWQQIIDSGIVSECAVYQASTGELTTTGLLFGNCMNSVGLGAFDYQSNFRFPDWIKCTITNKSVPEGATYTLTKYVYTQTRTRSYGTYGDGTDFDTETITPANLEAAKKLSSTSKTTLRSVDLSADASLDFIDLDVWFGDPRIKEKPTDTYSDWTFSSSEDFEDTTPDGTSSYTVDVYTRQLTVYESILPDCYTVATTQAEWPITIKYASVIRLKGINTADNPVCAIPITIGTNKITVDSDCNYYYFTPKATGLYRMDADSTNAYIGYATTAEDDEGYEIFNEATWADDGLTFDLWCYENRTVYIACSTADFSHDTYNLVISEVDD